MLLLPRMQSVWKYEQWLESHSISCVAATSLPTAFPRHRSASSIPAPSTAVQNASHSRTTGPTRTAVLPTEPPFTFLVVQRDFLRTVYRHASHTLEVIAHLSPPRSSHFLISPFPLSNVSVNALFIRFRVAVVEI